MTDLLLMQTPQSAEAEQSIVGAMLIDPRCVPDVVEALCADDFFWQANRDIFKTVCEMFSLSATIDPVTILDQMKRNGTYTENANSYMLQLMEITPTAANFKEYIRIVKETSRKRQMFELCQRIAGDANTKESSDILLGKLAQGVESIAAGMARTNAITAEDAASSLMDRISDYRTGERALLSTGLERLDKAMNGGLAGGVLTVIAARPGVGKTAVGVHIAERVAAKGKTVLYVTCEMEPEDLSARIVSMRCGIPYGIITHGKLTNEEFDTVAQTIPEVKKLPITYNREPSITVEQIGTLARSIKGLELCIIDHLGLLKPQDAKGHSRTEIVTEISGSLKALSLSLKIPIVALCQLNRQSEQRNDKMPTLADLRDSGSIEQDADNVILLHRGDYHTTSDKERKPWEFSPLQMIVAKNRTGAICNLYMRICLAKNIIDEKVSFE